MGRAVQLLLLLGFSCPALAFSLPTSVNVDGSLGLSTRGKAEGLYNLKLVRMRGGNQEQSVKGDMSPLVSSLSSFGRFYANSLNSNPIATKSVTACLVFAVSDWVAQRLSGDNKKDTKYDVKRTVSSAIVGLLYFGPAAHAWYYYIFKWFPGTGLAGTMQKAVLGQLLFGPSFTCIFFATGLVNAGTFSLGAWWGKIRTDLPGTWVAGLGFWPFVDLISYSLIEKQWIPLFVNSCSLVWTVYLSLVSNRKAVKTD